MAVPEYWIKVKAELEEACKKPMTNVELGHCIESFCTHGFTMREIAREIKYTVSYCYRLRQAYRRSREAKP